MTSPFYEFNRKYHFLFRWDETVFPRRETLKQTVRDAARIALREGPAPEVLDRYSKAEQALIRTIAAGVALHYSGEFARQLELCKDPDLDFGGAIAKKLMKQYLHLQQTPEHGEQVARALGLRKDEITAVWAYTQANKEVESLDGWQNPAFMKKKFGFFEDGWAALTSALFKLPSFGKLGMTVSTYRTVRVEKKTRRSKEMEALMRLPFGSRLVLGCKPMTGGQRHVTSSAITMSKWTIPSTVKESGGIICYFGVSGVFINWLGQYSMGTDGGETLYPPGTIMQLTTRMKRGFNGESDIFIFEEIPHFDDDDLTAQGYYDDHTFERITEPHVIHAARASARTTDLLDLGSLVNGKLSDDFYER